MDENQVIDSTDDLERWAEELPGTLPTALAEAKTCGLPPALLHLKIRLGVRLWPDGDEHHFHAALGESLLHIFRRGGDVLGEKILPPPDAPPLDTLRYLSHGHHWSEPIEQLEQPLWLALVHGITRHLAIDYKLVVQINTRWGIAPKANATPRELLTAFGFDPAEFSLYYATGTQPLPPDVPLNIKRGERFEAQKDGRYGAPTEAVETESQGRVETSLRELISKGYDVRSFHEKGQLYVEVGRLEVPSPPWSQPNARILIAVPSTYPAGGLDAFYLEKGLGHQGGPVPYEQSQATINNRVWALISWHYPVSRPWSPTRDDLATHVFHCRGYFMRRGVTQ